MSDTILGIDKGILQAFALMVILVGSITTFFLTEYVSTILLGSVFQTTTDGSLAISADASTFLSTAEDDFVIVITRVNTGMKFASGLITVVAVILVFGVFLRMRKNKKEKSMDY